MNDEKRENVRKLAEIEFDTRMKYETCRKRNHLEKEPEEAKKQAVEYALAQAEWLQAEHDLVIAKKPTVSPEGGHK